MGKPYKSVTIILSPYHVGLFNEGVGAGPHELMDQGLLRTLEKLDVQIETVETIQDVDEYRGEISKSFEILRRLSRTVRQARQANSFPLVLSGNCMGEIGVAAGLERPDAGCVWFDAHDDYNTPSTMTSGYLDGMGVSMMAGESFQALMATIPGHRPFNLEKFVFCGIRDLNEVERERVNAAPVEAVWGDGPGKVDYATELEQALDRRQIKSTMIHLDVDVLDDSYGKANEFAAPGSLFEDDLLACIEKVALTTVPVSLTVASFDPTQSGREKVGQITIRAVEKLVHCLRLQNLLE